MVYVFALLTAFLGSVVSALLVRSNLLGIGFTGNEAAGAAVQSFMFNMQGVS